MIAAVLSKSATPAGFQTHSQDVIKVDFSACCKDAQLFSQQNLLLFLQSGMGDFKTAPPDLETAVTMWALRQTLPGVVTMDLHLPVMDPFRGLHAKLWHVMLKEIHSSPKHKLMLIPTVAPLPVVPHVFRKLSKMFLTCQRLCNYWLLYLDR